jgi:hypothetical protein
VAFPTSSLGGQAMQDIFDATQQALNLTLTTYKVALFTNTNTANPKTDAGYATGGGEVASGGGYTTGGQVVASPAVSDVGGTSDSILKFTIANPSWASASFTARGMIYYADPIAGDPPICYVNFGADFTASGGTFLVTVNASGLFTIDFTP